MTVDSVLTRAKRLISASVGSALDMAEEASGPRLMREAVRQAARAIDTVRDEQRAQAARRSEALARATILRAEIAKLGDDARYAKAKGREDLATAAITQQIAQETELEGLAWADDATGSDSQHDALLATLTARHARMAEDLAAFESGKRINHAAPSVGIDESSPALTALTQAEQAFYRALAVAGGTGSAAVASEVEALRRADLVAERMAALSVPSAPGAKAAAKKKASN